MKIYRLFNKLSRPRSYAGRILLICFFGTHVPLITFVLWILLANPSLGGEHWDDLLVLLLATLAGTGLTFLLVNGMLAPVRVVARALGDYRQNKQVPALPRGLSDEAGYMLEQVQDAIEELDLTLDQPRPGGGDRSPDRGRQPPLACQSCGGADRPRTAQPIPDLRDPLRSRPLQGDQRSAWPCEGRCGPCRCGAVREERAAILSPVRTNGRRRILHRAA